MFNYHLLMWRIYYYCGELLGIQQSLIPRIDPAIITGFRRYLCPYSIWEYFSCASKCASSTSYPPISQSDSITSSLNSHNEVFIALPYSTHLNVILVMWYSLNVLERWLKSRFTSLIMRIVPANGVPIFEY